MGCLRTLCKILDADVVKLLYLLHHQLRLVDLDDDGCMSLVAAREAELAQGSLDLLRDIDRVGLPRVQRSRRARRTRRALAMADEETTVG